MKRIVLIVLVALFVLWLVSPKALSNLGDTLLSRVSKETRKKSNQAVLGIENKIRGAIREKSQQILGDSIQINLPSKPQVEIVENVPNKESKRIVLVDYLTQKNMKLEFNLNTDYYLDLRNVPHDYCLFINEMSYPLLKNEYLKISFDSPGAYTVSFELCESEKFGEIVVK